MVCESFVCFLFFYFYFSPLMLFKNPCIRISLFRNISEQQLIWSLNHFGVHTAQLSAAQQFKAEWNNRKGRKMQSQKRYDQLAITKTVCLFRWIRCHFVITTMSETIWFCLCILHFAHSANTIEYRVILLEIEFTMWLFVHSK